MELPKREQGGIEYEELFILIATFMLWLFLIDFRELYPKITEKDTGTSMILTMNLYGDIMDAESYKIYALSNLPHNIDLIGMDMPTGWTEQPR